MESLTQVASLLSRLRAGASLVAMASAILPRLVASGRMSEADAAKILAQIPALKKEIQDRIAEIAGWVEAVQDRVEVLAQFLLFHRSALASDELAEIERLLHIVKGSAAA